MSARKSKNHLTNRYSIGRLQFRLFFLLLALEALVSIALIFNAPSERGNTWLLGLSFSRWLLVAVMFVPGFISARLFWLNMRNNKKWTSLETRIHRILQNHFFYFTLLVLNILFSVISFYLILLTFKFTDALTQARLERLSPLLLWIFALGLQTLIFAPRLRYGKEWREREKPPRGVLLTAALILSWFGLLVVFLHVTRLDLRPDRTGWDAPGVPLMATQVFMAWSAAILFFIFFIAAERRLGWLSSHLDLIASLVLWLLAVLLWQSQPLTPTYFSPAPRPPNFEYYPYSDAASHDLVAQNLIIGQGFTQVSEKPLYSSFLAVVHLIVGQNYLRVIAVQVAVLALLPAILYLLGAQLHHRFSGILLGLAMILRERNAISLSGQINVSHSKLLMTDLPAALGLALFTLLLIKCFEANRSQLRWPLWVGATLGFLLLLRSQIIIFLPLLLFLAFWQGGKMVRPRLIYSGTLLLGFVFAALPWLLRNYQLTGQVGYSQPLQALYLAKQYSLTPEANDPSFPEDTPSSEYVSLGFAHMVGFVRAYPGEVARFISAHFLHNEVSSMLALPTRFDLADTVVTFYNLRPYWENAEGRLWNECCSLDAYISGTPYWDGWDGVFPVQARLPLIFNLTLISLGISAAWKRMGWLALMPLGLHVAYNLSTAIARVSGWRLILPVDWVLILYYCIGLGQLSLWGWAYASAARTVVPKKQKASKLPISFNWRNERLPQYSAIIFVVALLLPTAEMLIPNRYVELDRATAIAEWQRSGLTAQTQLDPFDFLDQPGAAALVGRALYPRYYVAGMGEPGGQWPAFNPLPFSRLGFVLIGPQGEQVVLPISAVPAVFPNGADVLVFGCREESYLRAVAVVFSDGLAADLISDVQPLSCSS